jgi:hypothetical protein
MRLSGHALDTESEHKLVNADVTDADEGVELPGAKAEVAVVKEERQPAKVESLLRAVRYVEQVWLIPGGIKGVAVEFADVEDWAKATDMRSETIATDLNISED